MASVVVKICSRGQGDEDVDFLGVAGRRGGASGDAKWADAAVDPAGRPEEVAQRLRRQRFVAEFAGRSPQAERLRERPATLELRFGQVDRLEAGASGFARSPSCMVAPK